MIRSLVIAIAVLVLGAAPALAVCRDTPEHRRACGGDIYNNCYWQAASGDVGRVIVCLQSHRANLSPVCGAALSTCERPRRAVRRKTVVDGT